MEDAIAFSRVKEKKLNQDVFDNKRVYEVAESGPELSMDVLTDIVADFIKHRHIVDEDMQQDLYVLAYSKAYSTRMEVMSRLNSSYTIWCRRQRRHDEVFMPYIEENLPLKEEETEFKNVYDEQLRNGFDKAIEARCTERETNVVTEYFGMDEGVSRTLDEVAALHNVTRERIRQIVNKTLRKLRHPSLTKYYKDWVDTSYKKAVPKIEVEERLKLEIDIVKHQNLSVKSVKKPDLHYDNATLIELLRFYDIYEIADEISSRKGVYEKAKILAVKETTDFMKQFDFKGIKTVMYWDIKEVVSDILLYKSMKPKALKQKVESLVTEIRLNEDKNVMHSIRDYEDYQYLKSMLPK
jgi:RNA polymerase sigma factor (sigma-70 family)